MKEIGGILFCSARCIFHIASVSRKPQYKERGAHLQRPLYPPWFPRGGASPQKGSNLLFGISFAENCWKWLALDCAGGPRMESPLYPPLAFLWDRHRGSWVKARRLERRGNQLTRGFMHEADHVEKWPVNLVVFDYFYVLYWSVLNNCSNTAYTFTVTYWSRVGLC